MQPSTNTQQPMLYLSEATRNAFQTHCETRLFFTCFPKPAELVEASRALLPLLAGDEAVVKQLKELGNGQLEYLLVGNVPIDSELCLPPVDGKRPPKKKYWTSEMALLCLILLAGFEPLSYEEEKGDDLIHQVAPSINNQHTRSNGGTVELGWHTDDSILNREYRPDLLALLSLTNEPDTPTVVASTKKAFALLSAKHQQLLMSPLYRVQSPDSFDKAFRNKKILSEYQPIIIVDDAGTLLSAANLYAVESKNESARIALAAFNEALTDVGEAIVLKPGMLLIFNNSLVFHGRGEIKEGYRWLQRVFAKADLAAIRKATQASRAEYIFSVRHLII